MSIFATFVLVDLSIHGVRFFSKETTHFFELLLYYMRLFATHLDLFLPLSFLLAFLKILFDLNHHLELVALQMAGLSKQKLLLPFLLFALLLSGACYANNQWFSPKATFAAQIFKEGYSKHGKKRAHREHFQAIAMEDDSELIYRKFDSEQKALYDVFWIRSQSEIWHIKKLSIASMPPKGFWIDRMQRTPKLEMIETFEERIFSEISLSEDSSPKPFIPFESRSLSTLFYDALYASSDIASVQTHLHYKLALPLLSPLLLVMIAPFATRFSRHLPAFLIAAISLFFFIALKVLFDSLMILGENQVLPAWIAMWAPPAFLLAAFGPKFLRADK